jgi:hypothetical protein
MEKLVTYLSSFEHNVPVYGVCESEMIMEGEKELCESVIMEGK